jgi:hypothetical protein
MSTLRAIGVGLCLFPLYMAAGIMREGASLRRWDEAGTVMSERDDRPWSRIVVVESLALVGMVVWVPVALTHDPGRRGWRAALAQAVLFLAASASLLGVILISALLTGAYRVATPYRWLLAIEAAVAVLGFCGGGRLWAASGCGAKPAKALSDDLDV